MFVSWILFSGVFVLGILSTSSAADLSTCDDIDSDICTIFSLKVDVCNDSCFSKLCPRLCKKCPLKCLHCDAVSDVNNCTTRQICPTLDHVCDRLFGPSVIGRRSQIKRSSTNIGGRCCNDDDCNNRTTNRRSITISSNVTYMVSTTISATNFPSTVTILPPTQGTSTSSCADIDAISCRVLKTRRRDMCNDPCVVKACPRTCGECAQCYSCSHVTSPQNCTHTVGCEIGEKCYALETFSAKGEHGYRVGCMHKDVCAQFHTQAGNIFGRRSDPVELSLDGNCCTGDLCNHHVLKHEPSTTRRPGCLYKGNLYGQGQVWKDGCDYKCTCVNGASGFYQCKQLCIKWNLPRACSMDPPLPGKCCATPHCPSYVVIQYPPGYQQE